MASGKDRSFGQVIRERRRQLDLTQEEVAQKVKTSPSYVGHLESGKRHPSDLVLGPLAEVLLLDKREIFLLANPRAAALLDAKDEPGSGSVWLESGIDERTRRIQDLTDRAMEALARVAPMGKVRSKQDFIYIESRHGGEALELVSSYEPKPFFDEFREKYRGDFDWWRLEEGPGLWRVMIAKRENPQAWSIADFMGAEHRRLDDLWKDCSQEMKARNPGRIQSCLAEYLMGLRYHIRIEEEILFPAFEARTGMHRAGPTAVMRREHREIRAVLERLAALARGQDCGTIAEAVQDEGLDPSPLLISHDAKEDTVLCPMSDHILDQDERRDLILRMQAG